MLAEVSDVSGDEDNHFMVRVLLKIDIHLKHKISYFKAIQE